MPFNFNFGFKRSHNNFTAKPKAMKPKILLIAALLILSSCSFFRVIHESDYSAQSLKQYENDGKYLVLQRGDEAWHAYDLEVKNDSLQARLDFQLGYHLKYLEPKEKGLNKFAMKSEPEVINAVHIYTTDTNFNSFDTLIATPLSSIYTVRTYEYARAPSRASKIVPAVFIPVAGMVIYIAIVISSSYMTGALSF